MIFLNEAFKLVKNNDGIYLTSIKNKRNSFFFTDKNIKEIFDMKKVKVYKIIPHYSHYSYDGFKGLEFITNLSEEELSKKYYKQFGD